MNEVKNRCQAFAFKVNLYRYIAGLAGWGGTAVFGLFWMIGDDSFAWLKVGQVDRGWGELKGGGDGCPPVNQGASRHEDDDSRSASIERMTAQRDDI
jgi:hypothetical protein